MANPESAEEVKKTDDSKVEAGRERQGAEPAERMRPETTDTGLGRQRADASERETASLVRKGDVPGLNLTDNNQGQQRGKIELAALGPEFSVMPGVTPLDRAKALGRGLTQIEGVDLKAQPGSVEATRKQQEERTRVEQQLDRQAERAAGQPERAGDVPAAAAAGQPELKLNLSREQKDEIGRRIWQNESGGKIEGLTHWNKGESFASLGVGHFIWQPESGKNNIFGDSFRSFVKQMEDEKNPNLPKWLTSETPNPWGSKAEFDAAKDSPKMKELSKFLQNTIPEQTDHIIGRLEQSLPRMLEAAPENQRKNITDNFNKVLKSGPQGVFALADYVNFKGEGLKPGEPSYNNQSWGLRTVLQNMKDTGNPVKDFSESAKHTLQNRVDNAPAGQQAKEQAWMKGWSSRVADYQSPFASKSDTRIAQAPEKVTPKVETPKVNTAEGAPKTDAPKGAPKTDAPKTDAPKTDAPDHQEKRTAPDKAPDAAKPDGIELPKSVEEKSYPKSGQGYYQPMKAAMKELLGRNLSENELKAVIAGSKGMRHGMNESVNSLTRQDSVLPSNAEEAKSFVENIGNKHFGRQGMKHDQISKLQEEISSKFKMKSSEPAPQVKRQETQEPAPQVKRQETQEPAPQVKRQETQEPAPQVKRQETQEPAPQVKRQETQEPAPQVKRPETQEPAPQVKRQETQEPAPQVKRQETQEPAPQVKRQETQEPAPQVKRQETQEPAPQVKRQETQEPAPQVRPEGSLQPWPRVLPKTETTEKKPGEVAPGAEVKPEAPRVSNPVSDHDDDAAARLQPGNLNENINILRMAEGAEKHGARFVNAAKVLNQTNLREPSGLPKDMPVAVVPGMKPGTMGMLVKREGDGTERQVAFIAGQLSNGKGTKDDIAVNPAAAAALGIEPGKGNFRLDAVALNTKPEAKDAAGLQAEVAGKIKDVASQRDVLDKANESQEGKDLKDKGYIPKPDDNLGYRRTDRSEAELTKIKLAMDRESTKYHDMAERVKPSADGTRSPEAQQIIDKTLKGAQDEKQALEREKQQMLKLEALLKKGTSATDIPDNLLKDLPADIARDIELARYNRNAFKENNAAINDILQNPFGVNTAKFTENAKTAEKFYKMQEDRALDRARNYARLAEDKKVLQDRIISDATHPRAQELLQHRFETKAAAAAVLSANPDLVSGRTGRGALEGKRIAINGGHDPFHGSPTPGFGAQDWTKTPENKKGMSEYDFNKQSSAILASLVEYAGGVPIHVNQDELYKTNPSTQNMVGLAGALKDTKADVIISNHMDDFPGMTPGTLTLVSSKSHNLGALINSGKSEVAGVPGKPLRVQGRGVQAAVGQENMILNELLTTSPGDRQRALNPYEVGKIQMGLLIGMERYLHPRSKEQLVREKQRDQRGSGSWENLWNNNRPRQQFNSLPYPWKGN